MVVVRVKGAYALDCVAGMKRDSALCALGERSMRTNRCHGHHLSEGTFLPNHATLRMA